MASRLLKAPVMLLKRLLQLGLLLLLVHGSKADAALIAPSSLSATPYTSDSIALSWVGASQGDVNYVIERSASATTGFVAVGSTSWMETVYLDAALAPGTYYYRVKVVYAGSSSPYSNVASATLSGGATTTTLAPTTTSTTSSSSITTSTSSSTSTTKTTSTTSTSRTTSSTSSTSTSTSRTTSSTSTSSSSTSTSASTSSTKTTSTTSTSKTTSTTSTSSSSSTSTAKTTSTTSTSSSTSTTKTTSTTSTTMVGPLANAGPDQATQTLTALAFDGSGSSDPGGTITTYAWSFGDGTATTGMATSHAYATAGTYAATLTVTDSRGLTATDTASVFVSNRPPVANAGPDQTSSAGSTVTLSGTGSDSDGTIASYHWDFGDGASASGATVTHVYAAAGNYVATLTVTDDRGAQGSDGALVSVADLVTASAWTRSFGSAGADAAFGVATDRSGGIVMTGRVAQATDMGGVVCPSVSLFVAKYSPAGALQWARCFVAYGEGRAAAVDAAGSVIVTGDFGGVVDFGGGPVSSNGARGIFVVKYSPAGDYRWARVFGNGGYSLLSSGNGLAVDDGGNVLVTGAFSQTVNFGAGPVTSLGNSDIFTAKLSGADGAHLWSRTVGTSAYKNNAGRGVAVDAGGNVFVTGGFGGTADFGTGPMAITGLGIFITKYSPSGAVLWARSAGGYLDDRGNAIAVDGVGNVVVTGQAASGVDLGTGWLFGGGDENVFLAKYTSAGAPSWAKLFGSGGVDGGNGLAIDTGGNILLTGSLSMSADFGGGALLGRGGGDVFVAKFSSAGGHLWSKSFGSTHADLGNAVAIGAGGAPIVVGQFSDTVDFGAGALTSSGSYDVFLASLLP